MTESPTMHRAAAPVWPDSRIQAAPKLSLVFCSCLLAASIPLNISLYWIVFWLAPGSEGPFLRLSLLASSGLLAFLWYRAPLTHAELNLLGVLGTAVFVLLIPASMATHPSHALSGWLKLLMLFAICCFVTRGLRHPATAQVFASSLLLGGIILIAFILYTYVQQLGLAIPTYKIAREFKGIEEAAGVPLNSIAFAAVLSYLAGLCLVRTNWFLILIGVPLLAISSIFTGSRAPLVILAATVFVLLCLNGLRSKSLLLCGVAAFFTFLAVCSLAAILAAASDKDLSSITEGRWHLWSVGLHKFSERPLFGYGYESWRDDLVSRLPGEYDLTFDLAKNQGGGYHNQYISWLAEEGLIGAFAAGLIVWLLLRSSWLLAFQPWQTIRVKQWPLFVCIFLLLRSNFEVPGLFGYGQDPVDYLAYILVAIILSRFSVEEDSTRLAREMEMHAAATH